MAYVSQDMKKNFTPRIKEICDRYGVKGSLSVSHGSSLVFTVASGRIDFGPEPYIDVNVYYIDRHFDGDAKRFLNEVYAVMNEGNHNNSDAMTDYFDVGWYIDIRVGRWNKPYIKGT
jgi:hypothetical protein